MSRCQTNGLEIVHKVPELFVSSFLEANPIRRILKTLHVLRNSPLRARWTTLVTRCAFASREEREATDELNAWFVGSEKPRLSGVTDGSQE